MQEITTRLDVKQAEMKADQAKAKANQEDLLARMEEMNANQENAEEIMSASMKSNQDLLARLEARFETNREKDEKI
jgi:hypothetical protein